MLETAAPSVNATATAAPAHRSAFADFIRALLRTSSGRVGAVIILLVVLMALAAPAAAPFSPLAD